MGLYKQAARHLWHIARRGNGRVVTKARGTTTRAFSREAAQLYEDFAKLYYYSNETTHAAYATLRGFNLAARGGLSEQFARFCGSVGILYAATRVPQLVTFNARRAENVAQQIAEQTHNQAALAYVRLVTSVSQIGIAPWGKIQQQITAAHDTFEELHDYRSWGDSLQALGFLATCRGDYAHSLELYAQLLTVGEKSNNQEHQTLGHFGRARIHLRQGKTAEALTELLALQPYLDAASHSRLIEASVIGTTAVAHLRQDDVRAARQAADIAQSRLRGSVSVAVFAYEGYVTVAHVFLALWERAQLGGNHAEATALHPLVMRALDDLRTYARYHVIGRPRADLYQGLYCWLTGKPHRARRFWRKSLHSAEQLEMAYEVALIHYEIGRQLPDDDDHRADHLAQAATRFAQLGCTFHHAVVTTHRSTIQLNKADPRNQIPV